MTRQLAVSKLIVLLLMPLATAMASQAPSPCPVNGRLSETMLTDLLKEKVIRERRIIDGYVLACGVDFVLDKASEARLTGAGATPGVIDAVREKAKAVEADRRRADRVATMNRLKFEFVSIRPGEYSMGCSPNDALCDGDERPAHRVRITKGFDIGKYEVTQGMWEFIMGANPSNFKGAERPVEQVGWNEAQAFIAKLNQDADGYAYRLPTEAEWEYAARAGAAAFDQATLDRVAWYDQNSERQTRPVGQREANAWGLHDMLGNVWEWVGDWYNEQYFAVSPDMDPRGPSSDIFRSLRGGSWTNLPRNVRVSSRVGDDPASRSASVGFRVVRELVPR
jgi:formylglycine-generating enzyme required for sulfatase activity